MCDQKRPTESSHYDREASPSKKIALTTPSSTSSGSNKTKSPGSRGSISKEQDSSPASRIMRTIDETTATAASATTEAHTTTTTGSTTTTTTANTTTTATSRVDETVDEGCDEVLTEEEERRVEKIYTHYWEKVTGLRYGGFKPLADHLDWDYEHGTGEFAPEEEEDHDS